MVEEMTEEKLHPVWTVCWFVISPAILVTLIVLGLYDMANTDGYLYSTWQPSTVSINPRLWSSLSSVHRKESCQVEIKLV